MTILLKTNHGVVLITIQCFIVHDITMIRLRLRAICGRYFFENCRVQFDRLIFAVILLLLDWPFLRYLNVSLTIECQCVAINAA